MTEVYKVISTLKLSKSDSHDEISAKLLRDVAEEITPLTVIFNASISSGIFPEEVFQII
jgi:hypothetical protein